MKESDFKGIILFKQGILFFCVAGSIFILSAILFAMFHKIYFVWIAIFGILIFILLCLFFRNPRRKIVTGDKFIVSPADGKIVLIETNVWDKSFNQSVNRIAIFLSLFNVHINRTPVSGKVSDVNKKDGVFLPAFKRSSGDKNFQKSITINCGFPVLIKQITGIIARRIISLPYKGLNVKQGEIYGMILFGSRVEIVFPAGVKIRIKKGDLVKAGITIIGEV